jgi:MFS family permease
MAVLLPPGGSGAFRHRGFTLFWIARFLNNLAAQIVSVAVGWQVYDLTRNPFDLGLVGLIQFAPALLLVLVTGAASDRYNRRAIVAVCQIAEGGAAAALVWLTATGAVSVGLIFAVLLGFGIARAFIGPASQSLIPNLVPLADLPGAIAVSTSAWLLSGIAGPALGGLLYGFSAEFAYGTAFALFVAAAVLVFNVPKPLQKTMREPVSWTALVAGVRYVFRDKIVLGAVSMDLFAVLLGGAVALLPAYARDILDAGPLGLGFLRSAAGVGAIVTAALLAARPIRDHAGRIMLIAVGAFGLATLVFGVSKNLWLSVAALTVAGAADMVSVYIRETLIQVWTPDSVRGRVSAVNQVFIGASNELGEFRAGTMAALIGLVPAVVAGGVGTIAVAALWARIFPQLRDTRTLVPPAAA